MKRETLLAFKALVEFGSIAALAYGCWLAWHPAGFIVPAAVLLALGIIADWRK